MESDSLKLVDEDSLLSFVVSRCDDSGYLQFFGHVRPEFLSEAVLREYLSGAWRRWCIITHISRDTDELSGGGGGDGKVHWFACELSSGAFRYIRLTQTGKSCLIKRDSNNQFFLSEVEFFLER